MQEACLQGEVTQPPKQVKEVSHKDIKQIVLFLVHYMVYSFNFSTGNQYLQYCIQISTPVSLASFI